jgi:MoaA/NifB/PqqE/SkfB family radical SAM enzyme
MRPKHLLNLVSDRLHTLPLVVLYLTDGCNSRCVTCDIWRNPRRNMKMELVDEIAGACAELGVRWVLLSGGEAMQHPHWPEIARRFRDQGIYTMLLTNGLFVRKQAKDIAASVDELIVSLDGGNAATYHAIRGVDAFDLVIDGIRAVRQLGVPVSTRTTVQRANFREIPQIIEVAKVADVNRVSFLTVDVSNQYAFGNRFPNVQLATADAFAPPLYAVETRSAGVDAAFSPPLHLMERGLGCEGNLTPADITELSQVLDDVESRFAGDFASGLLSESPAKLRRMVNYFNAINGEGDFPRPRCNTPHISSVIEVDGTLRPCYFLPAYGQLNGAKLADAINLPAAQALRQAYRTGGRPECERCVCPLYKGPRALMRM